MNGLLNIVRTKEEANRLVEELDLLLSSVYEKQGEGFDWTLNNKVRYWVKGFLTDEIVKAGEDKISYLKRLKQKVSGLKVLELGVSFEPADEMIDRLVSYSRKIFGNEVVLDINYIPEILGGARIIFEGNYYDFSIRKVFEEEFKRNRDSILRSIYEGTVLIGEE